jgi:hypothetical protein
MPAFLIFLVPASRKVIIQGLLSFPEVTFKLEFIEFINHKTSYAWKGQASYYSLNGNVHTDMVWFCPDPKPQGYGEQVTATR